MSLITTATHPKTTWPGILDFWGQKYNEHPEVFSKTHAVRSSKKAYEEIKNIVGFPMLPVKTEGAATIYSATQDGYLARSRHVAYAMGYQVSHEELEDNLYKEVSMARSEQLALAGKQTVEYVAANDLNRAFSATYLGPDGLELCSTLHVNVTGGTWQNELTTAADLSETSIENMAILVLNATDDRGHKIAINPKCLIVPPAESFNAERILKSTLQNDTANNAINAVRNLFPEGVVVNRWLTDTNAWFIKTDVPNGLMFFWREKPRFGQDNDFNTENLRAKMYMRFSTVWADPHGIYGTPGSS